MTSEEFNQLKLGDVIQARSWQGELIEIYYTIVEIIPHNGLVTYRANQVLNFSKYTFYHNQLVIKAPSFWEVFSSSSSPVRAPAL